MKFTYVEKKMPMSEDLRTYAERKISKLDKMFKEEAEAYVTPSIERGRFKAEVTLKSSGMFYRSTEVTNDMYVSIDAAVASIERQIRKNKTRLSKKLREGAIEKIAPVAFDPVEEEKDFDVVRRKSFPIKPMSTEEAILQMNLLSHEFFVFKDQENHDNVSVVYKREDGGYGVISDSQE